MSDKKITINPTFSIPLLPIMIILKLTDVIDWSWIWVILFPFLLSFGIILGMILIVFIIGLIAAMLK